MRNYKTTENLRDSKGYIKDETLKQCTNAKKWTNVYGNPTIAFDYNGTRYISADDYSITQILLQDLIIVKRKKDL